MYSGKKSENILINLFQIWYLYWF